MVDAISSPDFRTCVGLWCRNWEGELVGMYLYHSLVLPPAASWREFFFGMSAWQHGSMEASEQGLPSS